MTKIDYPRALFFLAGTVLGCGLDTFLEKLIGAVSGVASMLGRGVAQVPAPAVLPVARSLRPHTPGISEHAEGDS